MEGRLCLGDTCDMGSGCGCEVSYDSDRLLQRYSKPLLNSTINHSSATKEMVHALKIVKPKMVIADPAVLNNLHQALATLDLNTPITILTLIERNARYQLVSQF